MLRVDMGSGVVIFQKILLSKILTVKYLLFLLFTLLLYFTISFGLHYQVNFYVIIYQNYYKKRQKSL